MSNAIDPVVQDRKTAERHAVGALWFRRFAMLVLTAVVALALANVAGQRASTVHASAPSAELTVHSPTAVRPGLLFQAKFTITARTDLPDAQLLLGHGWFDGLTLNTAEPQASTETSAPDGSVLFAIGSLKAGQSFTQYFEYQVNATSVSRRPQFAAVRTGGHDIVTVNRTMTIFP